MSDIKLILGDSLIKLKELLENSIDAVVTDPPYGLTSIVNRFGKENSAPAQQGKDGSFARLSSGFMGKVWDGSGIEYNIELWKEVLRVLKPGGHLLSFGGSRTYHRMACAIEDAGFEIRDQIMWVYGSGFPKSLAIGKVVDKLQGNEREILGTYKVPNIKGDAYGTMNEKQGGSYKNIDQKITKGTSEWEGYGTALKPAHEPIVLARKPLGEKTIVENVLKWGTGGLAIDNCRISGVDTRAKTGGAIKDSGWGTKKGVVAGSELGRFPANLIYDGSDEVVELFPNTKSTSNIRHNNGKLDDKTFGKYNPIDSCGFNDSGSASRFFYCAKASKKERDMGCESLDIKEVHRFGSGIGEGKTPKAPSFDRNNHPTVKPLSLMRYLITLISREGQTVLDPFLGSGTTGIAAKELNRNFIGIELSPEYMKIAEKRISHVTKEQEVKDNVKQETLL